MLVKSGAGSFSMVGGFVLSAPQPHQLRNNQVNPLTALLNQLIRRLR